MKKSIVIFIFLAITFVLTTVAASKLLYYAYSVNESIEHNIHNPNLKDWISIWRDMFDVYFPFGLMSLFAALATLAAMIIIAIKDFPVFQPLLAKLNAKRDARKQAKAEKAEADKQARIEQLQSELEQLKKDE